jgi:UDP-N-acetyl-D-mannosaminuronic acid dehydrogenase
MSNVCVIGVGRIGLPVAVTLARAGHRVTGVDVNKELVSAINAGNTAIEEPGLPELLSEVVADGSLHAETEPVTADAFIVSVPTPIGSDGSPIMDYLDSAASAVGRVLRPGNLVVLESTVPPGTTAGRFKNNLEQASELLFGEDFNIAHCPERVLPGDILREITDNDRIVGGLDQASTSAAATLYRSFVSADLTLTDATTAEIVKLSENIYRDVNIALANDLASVCDAIGADIFQVIQMANLHPRVNIHRPGPGVGGYCIPVASLFLLADKPADAPVIQAARAVNSERPQRTVDAALAALNHVSDPRVAVLGVAYKGGVGDARDSPASDIIDGLTGAGATVSAYDPYATEADFEYPLVSFDDALRGADMAVVITDHPQFKDIDAKQAGRLMRTKLVFDPRNALNRGSWETAGFRFVNMGAAPQGQGL